MQFHNCAFVQPDLLAGFWKEERKGERERRGKERARKKQKEKEVKGKGKRRRKGEKDKVEGSRREGKRK